jgi:hypothetical protein
VHGGYGAWKFGSCSVLKGILKSYFKILVPVL